jgi:hypothetical protein
MYCDEEKEGGPDVPYSLCSYTRGSVGGDDCTAGDTEPVILLYGSL